jgi:hypothetical protein
MTATLREENAYILMPIGPKTLFVATNDAETEAALIGRHREELVAVLNQSIVGRAVSYVYAQDDKALIYVKEKMGTRQERSLGERLADIHKE